MISIDAEPFLKNPDFQLRAFGALSPSVSLSRNVSASRSRHPVIVTGGGCGRPFAGDSTTAAGATAADVADGAATVFSAAGLVTVLFECASKVAAPISTAAPRTPR